MLALPRIAVSSMIGWPVDVLFMCCSLWRACIPLVPVGGTRRWEVAADPASSPPSPRLRGGAPAGVGPWPPVQDGPLAHQKRQV
jgi:hypothetical protein